MAARFLTPGVRFLGKGVSMALIFIMLISALRLGATRAFQVDIPAYTIALAFLIGVPLAAICRQASYELSLRTKARRLGARLPPVTPGRLPGNIDVLMTILARFKTGYPGMLNKISTSCVTFSLSSHLQMKD